MSADQQQDRKRDDLLRRALATPPISNEEILKRSKAIPGKRGGPKPAPSPVRQRDGQ